MSSPSSHGFDEVSTALVKVLVLQGQMWSQGTDTGPEIREEWLYFTQPGCVSSLSFAAVNFTGLKFPSKGEIFPQTSAQTCLQTCHLSLSSVGHTNQFCRGDAAW